MPANRIGRTSRRIDLKQVLSGRASPSCCEYPTIHGKLYYNDPDSLKQTGYFRRKPDILAVRDSSYAIVLLSAPAHFHFISPRKPMSKKNITNPDEEAFDLDSFLGDIDAPPKLEDNQLDALESFVERYPSGMNLELLDGFFCGLICGPDATGPDMFIPYIFGGNEPKYDSPAQAEEIQNALRQHWDHIEGMMKGNAAYYPFLYSDPDFKVNANDWALGFVLGLDKYRESWSELLDQARIEEGLLMPILRLYLENTPENTTGMIHAEDREDLITTLVDNLPQIYRHFDEAREKKRQNPLH